MATQEPGPSRWEQIAGGSGYGAHFASLVDGGEDIEGEARLADALLGRGSTVLDAGSGMGRTAAALRARGHQAFGVDLDEALLAQSRRTYPELPVVRGRLEELTGSWLAAEGLPSAYDLIVCVGNVMVYLAPGTERAVLARLRDLLAPGGRLLVGFQTECQMPASRVYPAAEFVADAEAVGLAAQGLFGSFELGPFDPAGPFVVAVLAPV